VSSLVLESLLIVYGYCEMPLLDLGAEEEEDDAFLRRFVVPEEDRHLFTSAPWNGGFRWFRSSNVVPLERERQRRQSG
jgi:hypothetical protein